MTLPEGLHVGPYEIGAPLGAGGMGEVYRALDTRLNREVAIKILPADVAADRDRLARFEREARAVSALNHPNIVTLYEVGTAAGTGPYLVMECIKGQSLRRLIEAGPVPIRKLLALGAQIAAGLAKAHAAGIVHRDLKPENVMVTSDGFAKILDFGLARLAWPDEALGGVAETVTLVQPTASGVILGTAGYLSPEQAMGRPADYRADQFALGALLYEMATGARPFKGGTMLESLTATIRDEPEPVQARRADLPAPVAWLIERCLAKSPDERYTSTTDLARDLAELRDRLSEISKVPAADGRDRRAATGRWIMRIPIAIAAGAVLVAVAFVAGRFTVVPPVPAFQPLTFERGTITGARFSPDGRTVYYSAAHGAGPSRIFVTDLDRTESRALDLPSGFVLGVSAKNELAILLTDSRECCGSPGVLARVPAFGGTPRHLKKDVASADWGRDGERMAVSFSDGRCEDGDGQVLAPACGMPRLSPANDDLAFTNRQGVVVQDAAGTRLAFAPFQGVYGLAWSHDGREVWFTASETGGGHDRAIYALSLGGRQRLLARAPGGLIIYDVGRDGTSALIGTGAGWLGINAVTADGHERALDLRGRTRLSGLSRDGGSLLLDETREVGSGAWLLSTDGKESVHLSKDSARGLSPDGQFALVAHGTGLRLLPTGAGTARDISIGPGLEPVPSGEGSHARWSQDGRRLFLELSQSRGKTTVARLYVSADGAPWRPVTPEGVAGDYAVSRDGERVAMKNAAGTVTIYAVDGRVLQLLDGEVGRPLHFSTDGRQLFLASLPSFPARVYRRDLESGRLDPWRTIAPADPTAVMEINQVLIGDDDTSYVYTYRRGLNDLYLARNLR